jgi:hypothetical protein
MINRYYVLSFVSDLNIFYVQMYILIIVAITIITIKIKNTFIFLLGKNYLSSITKTLNYIVFITSSIRSYFVKLY